MDNPSQLVFRSSHRARSSVCCRSHHRHRTAPCTSCWSRARRYSSHTRVSYNTRTGTHGLKIYGTSPVSGGRKAGLRESHGVQPQGGLPAPQDVPSYLGPLCLTEGATIHESATVVEMVTPPRRPRKQPGAAEDRQDAGNRYRTISVKLCVCH